jgi:hypothetical protein
VVDAFKAPRGHLDKGGGFAFSITLWLVANGLKIALGYKTLQ